MRAIHVLHILTTATFVKSFDQCEGEFCPATVPKPRTLVFTHTIGPLVGRDPVTGCYIREEIEHFTLCYGRNHCYAMPKNLPIRSKTLKVTNTHIKKLGPDDFEKPVQLVEVQIEGNYDLERISSGTFRHLCNLGNLSIAFNSRLKIIEKGAFAGLTNLKYIFLNNNAFQNIYEITRSLSFQDVPMLNFLILDSNEFFNISANDFEPMANSNLEELSINLCRIENIHPNAIMHLRNLRRLHLAENSVNSTVIASVLNNAIEAGVDIQSLNLFYMGFKKTFPKTLMEIIAKSNISQLNLGKNQFEVISRESFPLMPNLRILDLREASIVQVNDDAFTNLPNLKTLLFSGNRLSHIPAAILNIRSLTFFDMQENSPGAYFHVYFSFKNVDFTNMTQLLYLNLGYNGLSHLFDTSFKGLSKLQVLLLKNSSIFHMERNTFTPLEDLRVLSLANNPLIHDEVPDVFFTLLKLEVLILSGCDFKYITKRNNPFRSLKSLKVLGLERNSLKIIEPTDFQPLVALETVDLSYNLLNSWDKRLFANNTNCKKIILAKNKLTDLTVAMLEDFASIGSVNLERNAILCKCLVTFKSYTTWHHNTNESVIFDPPIYCGYPDGLDNVTVTDFLTKRQYGEQICKFRPERLYLLLPLICVVAFFTVLAVLGFWYRWHIKYWIFLAKLYLSRKGKISPNSRRKGYTNYEYDAFVSYSTEDRDFVLKLVTMMENHEPFLRLCVYERDFEIGTIISESVLDSVAKSRKAVLIISDNYAKSQWCRWESQICEHHRLFFENEDGEYVDDSLVLIKLSDVNEAYLTPTLKYLMKTRIYLQWHSDEKKQDMFWSKLRNTLGPPVSSQFEITHI